MSSEQPLSFEEMQVHIAAIEKNQKSLLKFYKAQDEKKDKEHEAIDDPEDYKKPAKKGRHNAGEDDKPFKNHEGQNDDEKDKEDTAALKAAIAAIAQEEDEDKREDMSKKAQEMMDENKEKDHEAKAQDDEEDEKKEARIASLEQKSKDPIIADILKVASIINPKQIKQITKDLKTASLDEVESLWDKHYKSFSASLGVKQSPAQSRFVPFQMNASLDGVEVEDDMYTASTSKEYSQLDTQKLMEKATEMYQ